MRISDWSSDVCSSDLKPRKKSLRERFLGRTPGKKSKTGRAVQDRMRKEGKLRENRRGDTEFKASNDKWYPLKDADMAHKTDADRKSVGKGKSLSVRVDLGGRRIIKNKNLRTSQPGTSRDRTIINTTK